MFGFSGFWDLRFGIWNFIGIWNFGIWNFPRQAGYADFGMGGVWFADDARAGVEVVSAERGENGGAVGGADLEDGAEFLGE